MTAVVIDALWRDLLGTDTRCVRWSLMPSRKVCRIQYEMRGVEYETDCICSCNMQSASGCTSVKVELKHVLRRCVLALSLRNQLNCLIAPTDTA